MSKSTISINYALKVTDTWVGNDIVAIRMGNTVFVSWNHIVANVVNGNLYNFTTLPEGFRPSTPYYGAWVGAQAAYNSGSGRFVINTSGTIDFFGSSQSGNQEFAGSALFITED